MKRSILSTALTALALASTAAAQQFPFIMQYAQGPITNNIFNDGVLTMSAPLGQSQSQLVRAIYQGDGTVTISQAPVISGSAAFSVTMTQGLPLTLTKDQTLFFTVRFSPASSAPDSARVAVAFTEVPATTVTPITLSLVGLTSAIIPSFVTPEDNNVVPLTPGTSIAFPNTVVGQSTPITLRFTNLGSLVGQVNRVSVSGAAFRLQDTPLFPASLAAGDSVQMSVVFRPTGLAPATGTLTFETSAGPAETFALQGSGIAPQLSYQFGTAAVNPGGSSSVPDIEVGQTSTTVVRVTNTGNAPATISEIDITGTGFAISRVPALPRTLAANASVLFNVDFTPARTGLHTGTVIVDNDVFTISGRGLGSALTFSYVSGGGTVTLGPSNNSVIFSPVRVTESAQLALDIRNTGTTAATVQNVGIGLSNSPFTIVNPPALPATIAPNGSIRLTLKFEPTTVGFSNQTLIVDNTTITLTGSGTAPPALPAYTLSAPSGTVAPLTQPNVGLKLAAPYPVALIGTLTLAPASGNLPADPSVQFATGGRTIAFRIPANSTDAIFGAQGTQVGLQSGTVAGTMTLTPSFATLAGNLDLTPANPVAAQFSVGAAAPTLLTAQILNQSASGFTLQLTGFTTPRTLTAVNVQFTTASGFEMPVSQFAIDLKSVAPAWFQSTGSQTFGGQFRVSVPFTFQLPVGQSILNGITTVSATAANESGTSAPAQARVQ